MPTNPPNEKQRHQPFPTDDRLYQIHWAGQLIVPADQQATRRVFAWLKQVDDQGKIVHPERIVQVIESAGAIPKLAVGSYWKNGRRLTSMNRVMPDPIWIDINAPERWTIADANNFVKASPSSSTNTKLIDRDAIALAMWPENGEKVNGHYAPVVFGYTDAGVRVVIPCYTVFRAFYAQSSGLSNGLLKGTWDGIKPDFIESEHCRLIDGVEHWHLNLNTPRGSSIVPILAMFCFHPPAHAAANAILPAHIGDTEFETWIKATPPVTKGVLRIKARVVVADGGKSMIVSDIVDFYYPRSDVVVTYSFPPPMVSAGTPDPNQGAKVRLKGPKGDPEDISKPMDSRPTKGYLEMPTPVVRISGLAKAKRIEKPPIETKATGATKGLSSPTPSVVSVGIAGKYPAPAAGQFIPEQVVDVKHRFQQLRDLFDALIEEEIILEITDFACVNPVQVGESEYCSFSPTVESRTWPWVPGYPKRPRVAMVLELIVDARVVYWIETEPVKDHGHHSVAIEMIRNESLDPLQLKELLIFCTNKKGVWPKDQPVGHGHFYYARVKHSYVDNQLSRNFILTAFSRLADARQIPAAMPAP